MTLLDRLKENSDEKLKIFNARLTPSVASERILGVRSPVVKALAKEFYGSMSFSFADAAFLFGGKQSARLPFVQHKGFGRSDCNDGGIFAFY